MQTDFRITQLASNLVNYSLDLKKGQVLYVEMNGPDTRPLGQEIIRLATQKGAIPFWNCSDDDLSTPFFSGATEEQQRDFAAFHRKIMERVDAYVGIRGPLNPYDVGDMSAKSKTWRQQYYMTEVHMQTRLKKRWCVLRYPNATMSTMAKMSRSAFEDFYFKVCNLDYSKMSRAMDPLVALMKKTDKVRLVAPGTDIEFSIRNMPVIKCDGIMNIPDGEVFTAPVKDSVNGVISYNTTSLNQGTLFRNIRLEVKNGRIVSYSAPDNKAQLDEIFNTDEGARYFGEFAIGVNPYILDPLNDTLFDEKIRGSIHLTPGNSYDDCDNGNKSSVHWDLVLIQTERYGGGEIYFDGKLVRKNGLFVLDELFPLNDLT